MYRLERQKVNNRKLDPQNLFKEGKDLGFEAKRPKKYSDMKMIEMVGSDHVKIDKKAPRERREDWRVSNVNFY